jgi:copper chaperone CopZ
MVRIIISRIDGVQSVEPNPITQRTKVVYDDTKTSPGHFVEALKRGGYQVLGEPKFVN